VLARADLGIAIGPAGSDAATEPAARRTCGNLLEARSLWVVVLAR